MYSATFSVAINTSETKIGDHTTLPADHTIIGVGMRPVSNATNLDIDGKTLLNQDELGQVFLTLKDKDSFVIYDKIPLAMVHEMSKGESRFAMMPVPNGKNIDLMKSVLKSRVTSNRVVELIVYYKLDSKC